MINTRFRFLPESSTLDDLERPIRTLLQKRCVYRSQSFWMSYCLSDGSHSVWVK